AGVVDYLPGGAKAGGRIVAGVRVIGGAYCGYEYIAQGEVGVAVAGELPAAIRARRAIPEEEQFRWVDEAGYPAALAAPIVVTNTSRRVRSASPSQASCQPPSERGAPSPKRNNSDGWMKPATRPRWRLWG